MHPSRATVQHPPTSWRRLLSVRDFAEARIRWCLGKGMVDFWYDIWCGDRPLEQVMGVSNPPHSLVAEFFTPHGWNVPRLKEWVLDFLVQQITSIHFSLDRDDVMDKGVALCSRCSCCQQGPETINHLFLHDAVAGEVWEYFFKVFGLLPFTAVSVAAMLFHWFFSHSQVSSTHVRVLVPLLVFQFIWKSRNKARFDACLITSSQVIFQIEELLGRMGKAHDFSLASFSGDRDCPWAAFGNSYGQPKAVVPVSWEKPSPGHLKLNTDASVLIGKAAGGGVLRDHDGRVISAYYKEFGDLGVLEAEAQALLEGLQMCAERETGALTVESDSKVLVQLVNSEAVSKWPVCTVLQDIRHLLHQMRAPLQHLFREANSVADALASLQVGGHCCYSSIESLPCRARGEARLDRLGDPRVRELQLRA
ncbi:uncharacterized protein [Coffea arabica]|uniref:RNase H type-1 domain-containing protein n=1 Tax=Coffea arabica TaxID=13443 RepID=A0A6P6VL02_COFAR|nr:uncharacterized protein LOC113724431 [Coffea arabica]